jgi:anti-sigma B factor antagonist
MDRHESSIGRSLRPRGAVSLRLRRRLDPDAAVLELGGEVDLLTAAHLAGGLDDEIRTGTGDVVVDLGEVEYIDSAGLQVLLSAQRRLARQGRGLGIVCPPGPVLRVFELSRLLNTLTVASSLRELRRVRGPGRARRRARRAAAATD